jgi:archaellum biogenesis ATPase FlaH
MNLVDAILANLITNEGYSRKVVPFLKPEYFESQIQKLIFEKVVQFTIKYNTTPTKETLLVELDSDTKINDSELKSCQDFLSQDLNVNDEWLVEKTEKWCQERAIYLAIMDSIGILDGQDAVKDKGSIPELLSNALSVSFDNSIGHDFFGDASDRYDFYHQKQELLPFDLEYFNKITGGGLPKKTLNVILAGTGVGKTLAMCHFAAANLMLGKNVLYITLEMAEERISERIDENLLNITKDDLSSISKDMYLKKMEKIGSKTVGKLIIKEYPTASVGSAHFRHLINELRIKKNFAPDVIYVDYINLCQSSRLKNAANVNSYSYIKAVAEELRGLAVEKNVPIISATQVNRTGYTNSDPGLEDTSESFGLPATADFMFALVTSDDLEKQNQIMVKQLKNRYGDPTYHKRFVVGVDRAKMRLYDVENGEQDLVDDTPVMDKASFGERYNEEESMKWMTKKVGRKDFSKLFGT